MIVTETATKTCTQCAQALPLESYHRDKSGKHGRRSRCKACVAEYHRVNRARCTERMQAWRAANPERDQENTRRYLEQNREQIREQRRKYRAENPHKGWESDYRKRSRAAGHEPVVETFTRAEVIARYGDGCWHCGTGEFEQLDHYPVAVADGGAHTLENVRPSCAWANRGMGQLVRLRRERDQIIAEAEALIAEALASVGLAA